MMRKKNHFIIIFLLLLWGTFSFSQQQNIQLPIYEKGMDFSESWQKSNDACDQLVKYDRGIGSIIWQWTKSKGSWCGWGIEALPINDLSPFSNGYFVARFYGYFLGSPPEVLFIDNNDNRSRIINFRNYMTGNPSTGVIVKIPIKEFNFNQASGVNIKSIKTLQLDAEYQSRKGKIQITYIGLESK
jgi:hypothetical protein